MRAIPNLKVVIDNTKSSKLFLTEQRTIYGGEAEVVRTKQSGNYWHFWMWISKEGL